MKEEDWEKKLNPEQYRIMRQKGTEAPFSGKYVDEKAKGMYTCAACGNELFSSDTKFDSGTGWPSFTDPANKNNIILREDKSGGMSRVEVLCKNCGSHLGHVFDDGPKGKQRYCINSACLELEKKEAEAVEIELKAEEEDKKEEKSDQRKSKGSSAQNIFTMLGMAAVGAILGGGLMGVLDQVTEINPLTGLVCAVAPKTATVRPTSTIPRATTSAASAGASTPASTSTLASSTPAGSSSGTANPALGLP